MTEPLRLSKCVVALTGCSRREAELYIEGGWVLVDGQVVDEPQYKVADHHVALLPDARPEPLTPVTLLLHKPAGLDAEAVDAPVTRWLTAEARVAGHGEPAAPMLRCHFSRLGIPLPLEPGASGLLVLTQEWQVARKLSDNARPLEQEYVADVGQEVAADALASLNRIRKVDGWPTLGCKVSRQSEQRLRFAGKGIQPGQIRSMCASADLQVTAIKRIRIGQVAMSRLQPGQWRYLPSFKRF